MLLISFQFELDKAIEAIAFIVRRLGPIDKMRLMKLLYIAERDSFLKLGHPITGDTLAALPWGPAPSGCLDAVNGQLWPAERNEKVFQFLHVQDNVITLKRAPSTAVLSDSERAILNDVLKENGSAPPWDLVRQTHAYPEYREAAAEGIPQPIPYESILRHYANGEHGFGSEPSTSGELAVEVAMRTNP
jgi:uncharacterized phage-associated protein